jgi:hypothetical protein
MAKRLISLYVEQVEVYGMGVTAVVRDLPYLRPIARHSQRLTNDFGVIQNLDWGTGVGVQR